MYKVLYQPELAQRLAEVPQGSHACLVFDGPKRLHALVISIAGETVIQQKNVEKFELAALMLNCPPSLGIQKLRLRSIVAIWRESEEARQREVRVRERTHHRTNFRADFGRMDIGLNPGWGRD